MKKEQKKIGLVAGPCSAESREQMMITASGLKSLGVKVMRAGLWKPRSRYGTFEGVGEAGLEWMQEIQRTLGLKVMTEVALPQHVEACLKAGMDMLWIGARTTVNPFLMQELAESLRGCNCPIWIKNPVCPDVELWCGGVDRFFHAGVTDLRIIHRGFCVPHHAPYRNAPLWSVAQEFRTRYPEIPFYCDPSHIAGKREFLLPICKKSLSLHVDGLFIESHCSPQEALSDAAQQLTPDGLGTLLKELGVTIE